MDGIVGRNDEKVSVAVRIRPLIQRERDDQACNHWYYDKSIIQQYQSNGKELISNHPPYNFDFIFNDKDDTSVVYKNVVAKIVENAFLGFNGTVLCYGQTSSGKTFTLYGSDSERGIISLTAEHLFKKIKDDVSRTFYIRIGLLEVYNEKVTDLLNNGAPVEIKEINGSVVPKGHTELEILSADEMLNAAKIVQNERKIGETRMNKESSRSHTILRILIESVPNDGNDNEDIENEFPSQEVQVTNALLNFVDLAGSEKASQTGAVGERFKESTFINKSLSTLSQVVHQLCASNNTSSSHGSNLSINFTDPPGSQKQTSKYINYRDSKLTRILQSSLSGNAFITLICNITPAAIEETHSTLRFARTAKKIKLVPIKNQGPATGAQYRTKIVELESLLVGKTSEVDRLKKQIFVMQRFCHPQQRLATHSHPERRRTLCPSMLMELRKEVAGDLNSRPIIDDFKIPLLPIRRSFANVTSLNDTSNCNSDLDKLFLEKRNTPEKTFVKPKTADAQTETDFEESPGETTIILEASKVTAEKWLLEQEHNQVLRQEWISEKSFMQHEHETALEEKDDHMQSLLNEVAELRSQLQLKTNELTENSRNLKQLKNEKNDVEQELFRTRSELEINKKYLQGTTEQIDIEIKESKKRSDALKSELQEARDAKTSCEKLNEEMASTMTELKVALEQQEANIQKLLAENAEQNKNLASLVEKLEKASEFEPKFERVLLEKQQMEQQKDAEYQKLVDEISVLQVRMKEHEAALEGKDANLQSLLYELAELKSQLQLKTNEFEVFQTDNSQNLKHLQEEKADIEQELLRIRSELETNQKCLQETTEQIEIERQENAKRSAAFGSELQSMKDVKTDCEKTNAELVSKLEKLKVEMEQYDVAIQEENELKRQNLESLVAKLERATEFETKFENLLSANQEMERQKDSAYQQLVEEIRILEVRTKEYEAALEGKHDNVQSLLDQNVELKSQLQLKTNEFEVFQRDNSQNLKHLQEKNADIEQELLQVRSELETNQKYLQETTEQIEIERQENEKRSAAFGSELQLMKDAKTDCEKTNAELVCKLEELKVEMEQKDVAVQEENELQRQNLESLVAKLERATEFETKFENLLSANQETEQQKDSAYQQLVEEIRILEVRTKEYEAALEGKHDNVQSLLDQNVELRSQLQLKTNDLTANSQNLNQLKDEKNEVEQELFRTRSDLETNKKYWQDLTEQIDNEIKESVEQSEALKSQLQEARDAKTSCEKLNEEMASTMTELKVALEQQEANIQKLVAENAEQNKNLASFVEKLEKASEFEPKFERVLLEKQQKDTEYQKLVDEISVLQIRIKEHEATSEGKHDNVQSVLDQNVELKSQLQLKTNEFEVFQTDNSQNLKHLQEEKAEIEQELLRIRSELETNRKYLQETTEQIEIERQETEKRSAAFGSELQLMKDAKTDCEKTNAELVSKLQQLIVEMEQKDVAVQKLIEENKLQRQNLESLVAKLERATEFETKFENLLSANQEMEQQKDSAYQQLVEEIRILEVRTKEYEAALEGKHDNVQSVLDQNVELRSQLQLKTNDLMENSQNLINVMNEKNDIEEQLQRTRSELETNKKYWQDLTEQIDNEIKESVEQSEALKSKLQEARDAKTSCEKLNEEMASTMTELKVALEQQEANIQKLLAENAEQNKNLASLVEKLEKASEFEPKFERVLLEKQQMEQQKDAEYQKLVDEVSVLQVRIKELEAAFEGKADNTQTLLDQVGELRSELQLKTNELEQVKTQCSQNLEHLKNEKADIEQQLYRTGSELEKNKKYWEETAEQIDSEIKASAKQHEALLSDLKKMKDEKINLLKSIDEMASEMTELKVAIEQKEAEVKKLLTDNELQKQNLISLNEKLQETSEVETKFKNLLSATQLQNDAELKKLVEKSNEEMMSKMNELKVTLEQKETAFQKLLAENELHKKNQAEKLKRASDLEAKFKHLLSAKQEMEQQKDAEHKKLVEEIRILKVRTEDKEHMPPPKPKVSLRSVGVETSSSVDIFKQLQIYQITLKKNEHKRKTETAELNKQVYEKSEEAKQLTRKVNEFESTTARLSTNVRFLEEELTGLQTQIPPQVVKKEVDVQCDIIKEMMFRVNRGDKIELPAGFPDIPSILEKSRDLQGEVAVLREYKSRCCCAGKPIGLLTAYSKPQIRVPERRHVPSPAAPLKLANPIATGSSSSVIAGAAVGSSCAKLQEVSQGKPTPPPVTSSSEQPKKQKMDLFSDEPIMSIEDFLQTL